MVRRNEAWMRPKGNSGRISGPKLARRSRSSPSRLSANLEGFLNAVGDRCRYSRNSRSCACAGPVGLVPCFSGSVKSRIRGLGVPRVPEKTSRVPGGSGSFVNAREAVSSREYGCFLLSPLPRELQTQGVTRQSSFVPPRVLPLRSPAYTGTRSQRAQRRYPGVPCASGAPKAPNVVPRTLGATFVGTCPRVSAAAGRGRPGNGHGTVSPEFSPGTNARFRPDANNLSI